MIWLIPPETSAFKRLTLSMAAQDWQARQPGIFRLQCSLCKQISIVNADDRTIDMLLAMDRGWEFPKPGTALCPSCPK